MQGQALAQCLVASLPMALPLPRALCSLPASSASLLQDACHQLQGAPAGGAQPRGQQPRSSCGCGSCCSLAIIPWVRRKAILCNTNNTTRQRNKVTRRGCD